MVDEHPMEQGPLSWNNWRHPTLTHSLCLGFLKPRSWGCILSSSRPQCFSWGYTLLFRRNISNSGFQAKAQWPLTEKLMGLFARPHSRPRFGCTWSAPENIFSNTGTKVHDFPPCLDLFGSYWALKSRSHSWLNKYILRRVLCFNRQTWITFTFATGPHQHAPACHPNNKNRRLKYLEAKKLILSSCKIGVKMLILFNWTKVPPYPWPCVL